MVPPLVDVAIGYALHTAERSRERVGKGDWRGISRNFVKSRIPTQVASHAQKYFLRQINLNRRRRRSSLFDIITDTVMNSSSNEEKLHQEPHPSTKPPLNQSTRTHAPSAIVGESNNSSAAPLRILPLLPSNVHGFQQSPSHFPSYIHYNSPSLHKKILLLPTATSHLPMNSTSGGDGFFGNIDGAGYTYSIGVSVGVVILITTITLASYFCTRSDTRSPPQADGEGHQRQQQPEQRVIEIGIDEESLRTYPKLLYSKANFSKKDSAATCCSICLADYKNDDVLRLLPDCNHIFHLRCIDPWLRLHPTCPLCRTSPLPTPLAEVAPLAAARMS
ncbi:hypothetical protein V2J09_018608 [Rumex salicifolius]